MMMKQFGILIMMLLLFGAAHAQVTTTIKDLRVPNSFQLSLNKVVAISKDTNFGIRRDNYLITEKAVKDLIERRAVSGGSSVLNGTGFVKASGTTISYDNSTYITSSALSPYLTAAIAATTYQPVGSSWGLIGNNINAANFLGSTNNSSLRFRTNGVERLIIDSIGRSMLLNSIIIGQGAGSGGSNIAFGSQALASNVSGYQNIAIGKDALGNLNNGYDNVGAGFQVMQNEVSGVRNVAIGNTAMKASNGSASNVAIGHGTLTAQTLAYYNTAVGGGSLQSNLTSNSNTGVGGLSLAATVGANNIGAGYAAGRYNTIGNNQIFINSLDRTDYTGDQNGSPLYVQQNAVIGNQNVTLNGNVGINTTSPAASSALEITSTTKGLLIPRMTGTQMNAIASPATGLIIFNTTDGVTYYYNGTAWRNIASIKKDNIGVTHADANGIILENTTPATAILSQSPPDIVMLGNGWGTIAGTSQKAGYRMRVDPDISSVASCAFRLDSWYNGAYQSEMSITNNSGSRNVTFAGAGFFGGKIEATSFNAAYNGTGYLFSAGQGSIFNSSGVFNYAANYGHTMSSGIIATTSGTGGLLTLNSSFAPLSGTAVYNGLSMRQTINQTGGANGITRSLFIDPILTSAADYRAIEVTGGKIVFAATNTATGTTGSQTINKISGKVNFAAGPTSLIVTNSLVTANSIIIPVAESSTPINVSYVPAAGSFTLYIPSQAAETKISFLVIN